MIREIYSTKGLKGFYAGSLPNFARCVLKNSYKYPLLVGLPSLYNERLPDTIRQNKQILKLLTGASIALIETTILCPAERVKVYFMTQNLNQTYKGFFTSIRGNVWKELFRGYTPLFFRQSMNWTVFLQTDLFVKTQIRRTLNLHDSDTIQAKYLMPASVLVAIVNTTMVMPLDCVKTHMEKINPTSSYRKAFRTIYNQAGMLGFFVGVRLRFVLYLSNAIFAVNFLEKLESIAKFMNKD